MLISGHSHVCLSLKDKCDRKRTLNDGQLQKYKITKNKEEQEGLDSDRTMS